MTIPADLRADLDLLTQALDVPATDVARTFAALMADAATAVPSYIGLSVLAASAGSDLELTTLESTEMVRITTSLRIPLSPEPPPAAFIDAQLVLILYAATSGAFVDLAADLAWLTGLSTGEIRLDEDVVRAFHPRPAESLRSQSTINQAIGVLIGQGRTPEQAHEELGLRAIEAGIPLHSAAAALLALETP